MSEKTPSGPVCWCGEDWTQAHADATEHRHDEDMDCCADGPPHPLGEHFPLPPRTHGRAERIRIALTDAGVPDNVMGTAVKAAWGFTREAHYRAWERSRESTKRLDAEQIASLTAELERETQARLQAEARIAGLETDLTLRGCLFPGCLRQLDIQAAMEGRQPIRPSCASDGWQQMRPTMDTGYICPDHASLVIEHQPKWEITGEQPQHRSALRCACGWVSPAARWRGVPQEMWKEHLLLQTETEQGGS